jgi:polyhydroxyalkanoate synthesis regulator phasin
MEERIQKVVKTGYGLSLLTLDQARKVASKVRKDLNLNEKESRKLAKELMASSEKAARDVIKMANKHFDAAVVRSGLASKGELKSVKKKIVKRVKKKVARVKKVVKRK